MKEGCIVGHEYVLTIVLCVISLLFFMSLLVDFSGRRKYLGRPQRFESLPRNVPFRVVKEVEVRPWWGSTIMQELILEQDVTKKRVYVERIVEGMANCSLPEEPFVVLGYGTEARIEKAWMQHSWSDR